MAHVKAGVTWEGEQMVSGQEKGSEEEHGLWGGRPGSRTGHPHLVGTGGQMGLSDKEVQNCGPINYQS